MELILTKIFQIITETNKNQFGEVLPQQRRLYIGQINKLICLWTQMTLFTGGV